MRFLRAHGECVVCLTSAADWLSRCKDHGRHFWWASSAETAPNCESHHKATSISRCTASYTTRVVITHASCLRRISTPIYTAPPEAYFLCAGFGTAIKARVSCWKYLDGIPVLELSILVRLIRPLHFHLIIYPLLRTMSPSPALLSTSLSLSLPAATSSVISNSASQLACQTVIYVVVILGIVIYYPGLEPLRYHVALPLTSLQKSSSPSFVEPSC